MKGMLVILLLLGLGFSYSMQDFCASPPFVGGQNTIAIPNVLISQDMTGSMRFVAYHNSTYVPSTSYYGYANPYANYDTVGIGLGSNHRRYFKKSSAGAWSGNKINYAYTARMDVARKCFTGGKGPRYNSKDTLFFDASSNQGGLGLGLPNVQMNGIVTTPGDTIEITKGLIREIADQDNNYIWDAGAPHFALQTFSTLNRYAQKIKCPFGTPLIYMLDSLERDTASGWTNCSKAIFEAIHYLRFSRPHDTIDYTWNVNQVGTASDPWYEVIGSDTVSVSCRPTFVIVVGDGGSNSDDTVGTCTHSYPLPHPASPYGSSHWSFWKYDYDYDYGSYPYNGTDPYDDCNRWNNLPADTINHTRPGDDYAYYAHVTDLRPDTSTIFGLPNDQTLTFYSVYLFAQREDADADSIYFRKIAMNGGFIDADTVNDPGYKKPDTTAEYDKDNDGRPDNFFYVTSGQELEEALQQIFVNINALARVTSGSAAAITSPGSRAGGCAYQAQFYPSMPIPDTNLTLKWLGNVQALWLDPYGFLREETEHNLYLHLKNDHVVEMYFDTLTDRTLARVYADTAGSGDKSLFEFLSIKPVDSLAYLWHAADWLLNHNEGQRTIGANIGGGVHSSLVNFAPSNNLIDPFLGLSPGTPAQCDTLIKYVRGNDYPNKRSRTINGQIWKLGDIINSSPVYVEGPEEAYNMIYGDTAYYSFWVKYSNRRRVIYTGANDGMVHAFNAGKYVQLDNPSDPFRVGQIDPMGRTLGEEFWAIIPKNLLPHLKWLMDTSYCHVYYNDLKSYACDVRIFTPSDWHPNGWGTILVTGMRFGGGPIMVGGSYYRSSYSVFDVTDPRDISSNHYPDLKFEFSLDSLGYTLCMPNVIKIIDKWFLIFGSGPQNYLGESTQRARVYIIDLSSAAIYEKVIPDNNTAITDIFGVDKGLNYSVDRIYFGTYDNSGGGKIYRLLTNENADPNTWTLHQVIDLHRPITAEGSAAADERGNLWIYFGTGKYLSNLDVSDADTIPQLFLGLKDDTLGTPTVPNFTLSDLLDVTDIDVYADSVSGGYETFDSLQAAIIATDGWYRLFDTNLGERVIAPAIVVGGTVIFTTFLPESESTITSHEADLCVGGGGGPQRGNLWALFYLTGTAYTTPILGSTPPNITNVPVIGDMPSEPTIFIGSEQEKVYIQTAGGLVGFETPLVYDPRGGVMLYRAR